MTDRLFLSHESLHRLKKQQLVDVCQEIGIKVNMKMKKDFIISQIPDEVKDEFEIKGQIIESVLDEVLDLKCNNSLFIEKYDITPNDFSKLNRFLKTDPDGVKWAQTILWHYSGAGLKYLQFLVDPERQIICRKHPKLEWQNNTFENQKQYYLKWKGIINSKKLDKNYPYEVAVYNNGSAAIIARDQSKLADMLEERGIDMPGPFFMTTLNYENSPDLMDEDVVDNSYHGEDSPEF